MINSSNKTKPRLLILEDEDLVRWSLAKSLNSAGYDVDVADSAESARLFLGQFRYDLLISDISLPGLSGLEFIASLDTCSRPSQIIIISTSQTPPDYFHGLAFHFVEKPFDLTDMVTLVGELLCQPLTSSDPSS